MADTGRAGRAQGGAERAAPFGTGRKRRIFGLDRSGPPPAETRAGQPLRPFTIPNAVGFLRLCLIPVFLVLAFDSADGRGPGIAVLYFLISVGDYIDGLLARLTGQYSRLGALLDPVVDRLTVLAGVVVCWHFELLPRPALAVLAARELVTLGLARLGMRRGLEIAVNWPGRIAVFPIMGSIFLALAADTEVALILLVLGIVLACLATALYAREGLSKAKTAP